MFVVICTTDADGWDGVGTLHGPFPDTRRIPVERRPTVVYDERAAAEKEAERLAIAHPHERFSVFGRECEAVRKVRESSGGAVTMVVIDRWPLLSDRKEP